MHPLIGRLSRRGVEKPLLFRPSPRRRRRGTRIRAATRRQVPQAGREQSEEDQGAGTRKAGGG